MTVLCQIFFVSPNVLSNACHSEREKVPPQGGSRLAGALFSDIKFERPPRLWLRLRLRSQCHGTFVERPEDDEEDETGLGEFLGVPEREDAVNAAITARRPARASLGRRKRARERNARLLLSRAHSAPKALSYVAGWCAVRRARGRRAYLKILRKTFVRVVCRRRAA